MVERDVEMTERTICQRKNKSTRDQRFRGTFWR
jgi:hypothetical protein